MTKANLGGVCPMMAWGTAQGGDNSRYSTKRIEGLLSSISQCLARAQKAGRTRCGPIRTPVTFYPSH